jgi:hypothetical protein
MRRAFLRPSLGPAAGWPRAAATCSLCRFMKGFVLGLLVAAMAFAGYFVWKSREAPQQKAVTSVDGGAPAKRKRKRGRGAARLARVRADRPEGDRTGGRALAEAEPEPEPEPEPIKLSAADRKMVAQGDDLGRADVVHLDMSDQSNTPELSQDDIDHGFRAQEDAILDCISRARPDPEAYLPGLVNVKFRIQRAGGIKGVRVEAPAILQKGGIYSCIKGVVERIRYPASGSSQIVTYPFRLS